MLFYGRPAEIIEELPRWGDIVIIRWQSVIGPMNVTTHRCNLKPLANEGGGAEPVTAYRGRYQGQRGPTRVRVDTEYVHSGKIAIK